MPFIDKKSNLTPANARAADVAHLLTESIAPIQQARMMSAFRVQGIQAILYSRLEQGRLCPCAQKNVLVDKLTPDGKSSTGAINRVLTGEARFGITTYKPRSPEDEFEDANFHDHETSPSNAFNQWMGDLTKVGSKDDDDANLVSDEPQVGDNGQSSPDLEDIFKEFDMSHLGITDVSCPICFGTSYVGGYTPFRAFRKVLIGTDFTTNSTYDLETFALSPGTHTTTVTLPRGMSIFDVFRTMNGRDPTPSVYRIDGELVGNQHPRKWFDGLPHEIEITTEQPMTHMEMQGGVSNEPVYFELPKKGNSMDIGLLEKTDPFQIIMSPDIPNLNTLDVIAECMHGKFLIVQTTNPWNTRNMNMLGWECQVRVAQPQELFNILPRRRPITGQKVVKIASPSKTQALSGVSALKGFKF